MIDAVLVGDISLVILLLRHRVFESLLGVGKQVGRTTVGGLEASIKTGSIRP